MKKTIKGILEINLNKKEKKEIARLIAFVAKAKADGAEKRFAKFADELAQFLADITEKYELNPSQVWFEVKELLLWTEKAL